MWGISGTGKTVVSLETVKIKVSHCKENKKSVRVIVTQYGGRKSQLLTNIEEYLENIKNIDVPIEILPLKQLCEDLGCPWDMTQPKDTINAVIRSLSSDKSHQVTIFVCDEAEWSTAVIRDQVRDNDHPRSSLVLYGIRAPIIGPFRAWKPPIPYAIKNQRVL